MHKWDRELVECEACPRLRRHCQKIAEEKRKSYADQEYWGRPVPDFGDPQARLLIVGLAPAAHGANRTGRMFTGDRSGEWLYRAMHRAGFANQAQSTDRSDGLVLNGTLVTAVNHCAPPDNKPTPQEIKNCSRWLDLTFDETKFEAVLALGSIAWTHSLKQLRRLELIGAEARPFKHGEVVELADRKLLVGSYHPSQQNTFTGRLTEKMFDEVFFILKNHTKKRIR